MDAAGDAVGIGQQQRSNRLRRAPEAGRVAGARRLPRRPPVRGRAACSSFPVNDWHEPTRGWADRVLPGDGVAPVAAILGALDRAGWDGFYDIEIFSDNGTFGVAYPDSLWDVDGAELVGRGRQQLLECWVERRVAA